MLITRLLEETAVTTERKKTIATYFAGAMAWHALTHGALAALKTDEPHKSLGIPMTPMRNAAAAALWAGVSFALMRYATTRSQLVEA